jgi:hypothetical protein
VSGMVAIGVMLYLFIVMINDECRCTEYKGWTQWMMAVLFCMKNRPKLTSRHVFECLWVAIIVEIHPKRSF